MPRSSGRPSRASRRTATLGDLAIELRPAGRAPPPLGADTVSHDLIGRPQLLARLGIGFRDVPRRVDADRQRIMAELVERPVIELDVRLEPARVAADDGERQRKAVARGADDRLGAAADTTQVLSGGCSTGG